MDLFYNLFYYILNKQEKQGGPVDEEGTVLHKEVKEERSDFEEDVNTIFFYLLRKETIHEGITFKK